VVGRAGQRQSGVAAVLAPVLVLMAALRVLLLERLRLSAPPLPSWAAATAVLRS